MARSDDRQESLPAQAQDLWHLIIGYAKQETLDPLKGLVRFLVFGAAGALVGSVGLVLLLLGALRLLQTETGSTFSGRRSFIPYLLVVIVSVALAGGAMKGSSRGQKRGKT